MLQEGQQRLGEKTFAKWSSEAEALKKAFPFQCESGIGYTGFRAGEAGFSADRNLPRTGHIHIPQLSLDSSGLHCEPYKVSVAACIEDLILREELPVLQVAKLGRSGLSTDGAYSNAVIGLSCGICAVAGLAMTDDVPEHVRRFLGAIRVSAQPDTAGKERLLRCISPANFVLFVF